MSTLITFKIETDAARLRLAREKYSPDAGNALLRRCVTHTAVRIYYHAHSRSTTDVVHRLRKFCKTTTSL